MYIHIYRRTKKLFIDGSLSPTQTAQHGGMLLRCVCGGLDVKEIKKKRQVTNDFLLLWSFHCVINSRARARLSYIFPRRWPGAKQLLLLPHVYDSIFWEETRWWWWCATPLCRSKCLKRVNIKNKRNLRERRNK